MSPRWHEVRDPVHNFILFDDFERRIIDSRPVQRLKSIRQLALTNEVYPGAMHNRFEHALGTMELAAQAFDVVTRKSSVALEKLGWPQEGRDLHRRLVRLGGLLHDIGHAPFSHAPEHLLPEGIYGHEALTEQLIKSDYITPLLRLGIVNFDPEVVSTVALGQKLKPTEDPGLQLLQEIIAGELGVDRIDYLVRDALHSGAAAGKFDYQRFLNTLTVILHPTTGAPVLALEEGGVHAAEGLLLARSFMFRDVYFHDVRRIYDIHLNDFIEEFLSGGRFPAELDEYLSLTDDEIWAAIHSSKDGRLGELAARITGRRHYRLAFELTEAQKARNPEVVAELREKLSEQFGDNVRVDEGGKEAQTLEEGQLYIASDSGEAKDIFQVSELIGLLKPIWFGRVYAALDLKPDVSVAASKIMEELT
jgi:HD superfamily phosphohydrolase